jgi:SHS2 domain-containing protein
MSEQRSIDISVESDSIEGLLVSWLNELIFHFDTYGFIGKRIVIKEITPFPTLPRGGGGKEKGEARQPDCLQVCKLKAIVSGEEFDPERHEGKFLIKAATYHRLKIEKKEDIWEVTVIFDI